MTENQIDHVAINKTWRSSLQDTRVKCSADAGSDHHLVVAEVKMKLWAVKKVRTIRTKYCTYKLKDQNVTDEFTIALANRYDALYNGSDDDEEMEPDLEEEWNQIKEMYLLSSWVIPKVVEVTYGSGRLQEILIKEWVTLQTGFHKGGCN